MAIPHLVAHRGLMASYPENTLLALKSAIACGAEYIEFDVQCTADGELIVIHDTELERTTGIRGNIFEMSYDEIRNIRAHEPERFSLAFFNQRIPLLQDVIRLLLQNPSVTAFVEIKEETLNHFSMQSTMQLLLKTLAPVQSQCVIISYDEKAIAYLQQHSHFHHGWVLHEYNAKHHQVATELSPDFLIVNHRKIPHDMDPWHGDWQWMVYDITEPELALHYASHNIDFVETRNICRMLEHPILALNLEHNLISQ